MSFAITWALALSIHVLPAFTSLTCHQLLTSGITIEPYLTAEYKYDQTQYWSSACSALLPGCILVPSSANEVSLIVKTLLENNENFAIKSGGHNPNQYFSSVAGGPLINLKSLNETTYDAASGTVRVGPGNRWSAVITALEPYNVTVVGGRIGHVGVGGYLVGGGLSYLSTQYGWAADNIVAAEVVLASGAIVEATNTTNVDLFNVLRGGGNNFGIVTAYTLQTHPIGQVWGGIVIFNSSDEVNNQLLPAIRDFVEYYPDDKAAVIVTNEITLAGLLDVWAIFLFYDGPVPPAGTFDNITNIGPIVNTCNTTTYSSFVSLEDDEVFMGDVYIIATESTPLPDAAVGLQVLKSYHDYFVDVTMANALVPGLTATMTFQPIPKRLARHAKANGGDLLNLDDTVDRIFFEFDYSFSSTLSDSQMTTVLATLFEGIRERALIFMADGTLPETYLPLFMNDANYLQDYWGRLRPETLSYAKGIREEYDPSGFFTDRTGGFKL